MANKLVLIAGASAAGKTRYAKYVKEQLPLPLMMKDRMREVIYERMPFDLSSVEKNQQLGACAYSALFYAAEELMRAGTDFAMESNFTKASEPILQELADTYGYSCMTVLFDASMEVLHQRFLNRERTEERHIGLSKGLFHDYEKFCRVAEHARGFTFGRMLRVDTADWSLVDYEQITRKIAAFLAE